ncbi:hypothetical protein [Gracilibacillus sp. Marseille-QA3620]
MSGTIFMLKYMSFHSKKDGYDKKDKIPSQVITQKTSVLSTSFCKNDILVEEKWIGVLT